MAFCVNSKKDLGKRLYLDGRVKSKISSSEVKGYGFTLFPFRA
jgi:hypothetical protein